MPDDSSGIYSLPAGTIVSTGDTILPSQHNPWANDNANAMSNRFSKDGRAPATGNWNLNNFRITNLGAPVATTDAVTKTYVDSLAGSAVQYVSQTLTASQQAIARTNIGAQLTSGQCRLALSGGNLLLSRFNGNLLPINGIAQSIPSVGVTLAATGLTPSTLYYIYAFMNSGTMTLEASTTAPATDTTTGVQIKTGDATRTLVGMARPVTGPAWVDSSTQAFVSSYFNRIRKSLLNFFASNQTTSSTAPVEISTAFRCEFLSWDFDTVSVSLSGAISTNVAGTAAFAAIGVDSTSTPSDGGCQNSANFRVPLHGHVSRALTVGYHFVTLLGWAESGATSTYIGNASALGRTAIYTEVMG